MKVEFNILVIDPYDIIERREKESLTNTFIPNENDKYGVAVLDLSKVTGWEEVVLLYNKSTISGIVVHLGDILFESPLIIEPEDFKKIYEYVTKDEIQEVGKILNIVNGEI